MLAGVLGGPYSHEAAHRYARACPVPVALFEGDKLDYGRSGSAQHSCNCSARIRLSTAVFRNSHHSQWRPFQVPLPQAHFPAIGESRRATPAAAEVAVSSILDATRESSGRPFLYTTAASHSDERRGRMTPMDHVGPLRWERPPPRSGGDDRSGRRPGAQGRLLLLGKGAVLAHRLARPRAADEDESQQRAPARQPEHEAIDVHHSRP